MAAGSWLRFAIGILLSLEVIRLLFEGKSSMFAVLLAIIYFGLVVTYALFKF